MPIKILMAMALAAILAACSAPTMDTSTDELAKESARKIRESLTEEKRAQFTEALTVISTSKFDLKAVLSGTTTAEYIKEDLMVAVHGKNADEIIAMADKIKADARERERLRVLDDIAKLEAKKQEALEAQALLKAVDVSNAKFSLGRERYTGFPKPVIELTVANGLSQAITRIYFHGSLQSPNRSIPWHAEGFIHPVPGGLEPGEVKRLSIDPGIVSGWTQVDAPADAVFSVHVVRVDGADSQVLLDGGNFTKADEKRLAELKSEAL